MARLGKKDLTSYVKTSAGLTQAQAASAVNAALDFIKTRVAAGDEIALVDFGTFTPVHVDERKTRNPATGEAITVPATTRPKFKAGKGFKDLVAG